MNLTIQPISETTAKLTIEGTSYGVLKFSACPNGRNSIIAKLPKEAIALGTATNVSMLAATFASAFTAGQSITKDSIRHATPNRDYTTATGSTPHKTGKNLSLYNIEVVPQDNDATIDFSYLDKDGVRSTLATAPMPAGVVEALAKVCKYNAWLAECRLAIATAKKEEECHLNTLHNSFRGIPADKLAEFEALIKIKTIELPAYADTIATAAVDTDKK